MEQELALETKEIKNKNFLSMVWQYTSKIFESKPVPEVVPPKPLSAMDLKVNDLIAKERFIMVAELVQAGYELSIEQQNDINKKMFNKIYNEKGYLSYLLDNNVPIQTSVLVNFLLEVGYTHVDIDYMRAGDQNFLKAEHYKFKLSDYFISRFEDRVFANEVFNIIKNEIVQIANSVNKGSGYSLRSINKFVHKQEVAYLFFMPKIMPHIPLDGFNELINSLENFAKIAESQIRKVYHKKSDLVEWDVREAKIPRLLNMLKDMNITYEKEFMKDREKLMEVKHNSSENKVAEGFNDLLLGLPKEAFSLIAKIKKEFEICQNNKEILSPENWLKVEDMWINKLPKVLKQFNEIPQDYRNKPNSQGKLSSELLIEALSDMSEIMKEELSNIGEIKLREFSVTQRHIGMIKKSI